MLRMTATIFVSANETNFDGSSTTNILPIEIAGELPINQEKEATNPWILGVSTLENVSVQDNIDYYLGSEFANENGNFENPYIIDLYGDTIKEFTLIFDKTNNQYAPQVSVDYNGISEEIATDDAVLAINLKEETDHLTITIFSWNKPFFPLKITGIIGKLKNIFINEKNALYIGREISDREKVGEPSYGLISNKGRITFLDYDGEVLDYAQNNLLKSGGKVIINIGNLKGGSQKIAEMYTDTWEYDTETKEVSVSLVDNLTALQNIELGARNMLKSTDGGWNAREYLENEYKTAFGEDLDKTQNFLLLSNYRMYMPYYDSQNAWALFSKIAKATNTHIFIDETGKPKMKGD